MNSYVLLLRGINVGGKNKVPMAELKSRLEEQGFEDVQTYIQSGNVILRSALPARKLSETIETLLVQRFTLDSAIVRTLALDYTTYKAIVSHAPEDFGKDNANYRYDVVFLIDVSSDEAMRQIATRRGIDMAWQGDHVIYFRRPSLTSADATKSALVKIAQQPIYASITIRNWNTTQKLLHILEASKE
jgi:uncharacterized protein (DUF1697 family)